MARSLREPVGGKKQRTHRALVAATRAVINDTGGFNADAVVERVGMAPATFYMYFPSKDEALAAALDDSLGELIERTLEAWDVEQLLEHGLRAVLDGAVAAAIDVFTSSALVMRLSLARLPESRTIREVYRHHQHAGQQLLRRFITLGQAAGRIRAGDPDAMTTAVLVAMQGLNNPLLLHRRAGDAVIGRLVDMLASVLEP